MQPSPLLSASPSFNSYSSDRLAEIAAKVIEEEATREPEARGSDNKPPSEGSSHGQEQQEEHDHEEEDEDEDDFEFPFVFIDPNGSPSSADEIFYKGHLQPTFPVFNRDLLVADDHGEDSVSAKAPVSPVRLPLGKLFIAERDPQSSSSSEADELESVPAGTYCAWRPNSAEASPDRCKKSNSTGSLKKWRLRDLVNRSSSDGKDAFVFLPPPTVKTNTGTKKESKPESSKERRNSGDVKLDGNMKFKRMNGNKVSAHEIHYVKNRALKEEGKRRSFLPYRQDLVGLFSNVNGFKY